MAEGMLVCPYARLFLEPEIRRKVIADREDEYHAQRLKAVLSPVRADPFKYGMCRISLCAVFRLITNILFSPDSQCRYASHPRELILRFQVN